jgi:hypothetical protein
MNHKIIAVAVLLLESLAVAQPRAHTLTPPVRTVDLNVGESSDVELADGSRARVKLLELREVRDELRNAVRRAEVVVEVNGQKVTLVSANYRGSGGWSHLHFDISGRQPSGKWGIIEGYAFLWEAYLKQYQPRLLAVARPHHVAAAGTKVTLDGSRSWSAGGKIASFDWTFNDGQKAAGPTVDRVYSKPGVYSEVLKITDAQGRIDYDFAVVHVLAKDQPNRLPPSIHANYYPTFGIKLGQPVHFLVRTFRTTDGKETWDFGDGSPKVEVQSDGNVVPLAKDGYARTVHRFEKPGHYLIRVERANRHGYPAMAHLHVRVGED